MNSCKVSVYKTGSFHCSPLTTLTCTIYCLYMVACIQKIINDAFSQQQYRELHQHFVISSCWNSNSPLPLPKSVNFATHFPCNLLAWSLLSIHLLGSARPELWAVCKYRSVSWLLPSLILISHPFFHFMNAIPCKAATRSRTLIFSRFKISRPQPARAAALTGVLFSEYTVDGQKDDCPNVAKHTAAVPTSLCFLLLFLCVRAEPVLLLCLLKLRGSSLVNIERKPWARGMGPLNISELDTYEATGVYVSPQWAEDCNDQQRPE